MASTRKVERHKDFARLSSVLSYAVLEWLLMLLLFLNAAFSYLVTKFANFCKLQTPCLLCSRLDHILGNEKEGFYTDLICDSHKSEISSLSSYYVVDQEVVNVREMSEVIGTDANDIVYDFSLPTSFNGGNVEEVPLLRKETHCSCCSLLRKKSDISDIDGNDISLSDQKDDGVGSDKIVEESSGFDDLSRIGYSEVKITSDSESEVPLLDNEAEDVNDQCIHNELSTILSDDTSLEKLIHTSSLPITEEPLESITSIETSETICEVEENVDMGTSHNASSVPSYLGIDHGLEAINWNKMEMQNNVLDTSETICETKENVGIGTSRDASVPSTLPVDHGLEEIDWNKIDVQNNAADTTETVCEIEEGNVDKVASCDISSMPSSLAIDHGLDEIDWDRTEVQNNATETCENMSKTKDNVDVIPTDDIKTNNDPSMSANMDLNDAYNLAIGNKSNMTSPTVTEVITGRDSFRAYEDLKLLISQVSAARGLENPWSEQSPSPRISDASSSPLLLQNITNRISLERNESGFESLDGSIVSEIEGESIHDRLKRQIELDRKSLYLLYKELEEERSASAIAANQAMAMITKLHEEKAAIQVEALQYQRMMEDQAEYDQDALHKLNEILAEREQYIQVLEADIERFRKQSENEFEDEKLHISDCLKKLEEKLRLFSNNGIFEEKEENNQIDDWVLTGDSSEDSSSSRKEASFTNESEQKSSKLSTLQDEISSLSKRLEALEADRSFIEHTINSLRNGDSGMQLVQEIATDLRELRRISIKERELGVS